MMTDSTPCRRKATPRIRRAIREYIVPYLRSAYEWEDSELWQTHQDGDGNVPDGVCQAISEALTWIEEQSN